jgi:biopolymer transport protein TolQ
MMPTPLIAAHISPLGLFAQADALVKTIMVLLVLASVATWAIAINKLWRLRRIQKTADQLRDALKGSDGLKQLEQVVQTTPHDPFAQVHTALVREWSESTGILDNAQQRDSFKERTERVADIAIQHELETLHSGLPVLATVGSVAPFVGLFGTVWGIMNSFQNIAASNNTSLSVVAPGIAEALLATALGLVAAIPAVIAYNRASGVLARYAASLQALTGLIAVQVSRLIERGEPLPSDHSAAIKGSATAKNDLGRITTVAGGA